MNKNGPKYRKKEKNRVKIGWMVNKYHINETNEYKK